MTGGGSASESTLSISPESNSSNSQNEQGTSTNSEGTERRSKSQRIKSQNPSLIQIEETTNLVWTDLEKVALIDTLNKYGYASKYTFKCLKGKTEEQIKNFLKTRMRMARDWKNKRGGATGKSVPKSKRKNQDNVKAPLEEWITYMASNISQCPAEAGTSQQLMLKLLPFAFFVIANFEAHPDPKNSCGINFKDFYEFLYTSLLGLPTKMLSKSTASFLFTAFYDSCKHYKTMAGNKETYYLNAISNVPDQITIREPTSGLKTYPGKRKRLQVDGEATSEKKSRPIFMEELLKIPSLNPFKIPIDHLEIPDSVSLHLVEK